MEILNTQQNTEAERALIVAVMLAPALFDQVQNYLQITDFFLEKHRALWRAFSQLREGKHDFNPVVLWTQIKRNGQDRHFAGAAELAEYIQGMPFFSHFESVREYCELVLRNSLSRQMLRLSSYTQAAVTDGERDEFELIADLQNRLKLLEGRRLTNDWQTAYGSLRAALTELEATADGNCPNVVRTGFAALDDLLINHGLTAGQYFLLAARTSKGKSTLALQMAINALRHDPAKVCAYFTVEMTPTELMKRAIAIEAEIPYNEFRQGLFSREQATKITQLENEVSRWQFPIIHRGKLTPATIYSDAYRIKQEYGRLDLVVIDHIGLLRPDRKADTRAREMGQISQDIKSLLVDLSCAGIVPVQVNREGGKSDRIELHHLRDSGELEQDADLVALINHTTEYPNYNEVALDLAKQRNGRTGVIELLFDLSCGRFNAIGTAAKTRSEINWKPSVEAVSYWDK